MEQIVLMVFLTLFSIVAALLSGAMVFRYLWMTLTKARVRKNSEGCMGFERNMVFSGNDLDFWRSALMVQRRCADNGHLGTCLEGDHEALCSESFCGTCGSAVDTERAALALSDMGLQARRGTLGDVRAALSKTRTMEDVLNLFALAAEDHTAQRALMDHAVFFLKCYTIAGRQYDGLPFILRLELAQSVVDADLVELYGP